MEHLFYKELTELINKHSLEHELNDTPDFVLADVAITAMQQFASLSAKRDDWHGFNKPKLELAPTCEIKECEVCTINECCETYYEQIPTSDLLNLYKVAKEKGNVSVANTIAKVLKQTCNKLEHSLKQQIV